MEGRPATNEHCLDSGEPGFVESFHMYRYEQKRTLVVWFHCTHPDDAFVEEGAALHCAISYDTGAYNITFGPNATVRMWDPSSEDTQSSWMRDFCVRTH